MNSQERGIICNEVVVAEEFIESSLTPDEWTELEEWIDKTVGPRLEAMRKFSKKIRKRDPEMNPNRPMSYHRVTPKPDRL